MADTSAISPLSGGYLLIVLTEPHSEQHKQVLLERLAKGQFVVVIRFFSPVVIARAAESAKWWRWLQLRSRSPKFSGRCLSPPMCSFVIVLFFSRKKRETPHRNILHDRWAAAIIIDVESRSADVASDLMSIRFSFSLPCISVYFFSAETPLRQNGGSPTHTSLQVFITTAAPLSKS